jgi:uncharacterized protein YjgD (DUF1641 family)
MVPAPTATDGRSAAAAPGSVEERLDRLAIQLEYLTGELQRQRHDRERWRELVDDLSPLVEQAMGMAINHLAEDDCQFSDLWKLAHTFVQNAAVLEAWIGPLRTMSALADELGPLAAPAASSLNDKLQQLDERGYFRFLREASAVVDKVVTSFTEEDVRLLGDNIVLILQTVKQMTQPEVMGLLGRTALAIREDSGDGRGETPSLLALLKQIRDPQVRRGLGRLVATLRAVGAESPTRASAAPAGDSPAIEGAKG